MNSAAPSTGHATGLLSSEVLVGQADAVTRIGVPAWATIARVRITGGGTASGCPGETVEGVMSVRAGSSLRVRVGSVERASDQAGEDTTLARDGKPVARAAGGGRATSHAGPMWNVDVSTGRDPRGSAVIEFIGLESVAPEWWTSCSG